MSVDVPAEALVGLLLASVRIIAWLVIAPPFSHRGIPVTVKVLLGVGLGLAVTPALGDLPALDAGPLAVAVAQQVVVGSALGFLCLLVFTAAQVAGDLIDVLGGFALAHAFDPLMQTGGGIFGKLYQLTALALLFASDGHLLVLHGLMRTYDLVPVDGGLSLAVLGNLVTTGLGQLFLSALQIAGPLVAVLFLADVGLGLLTRVAPALNAFALGFPLKIFMTLSLVGFSLAVLPQVVGSMAQQAAELIVGAASG